MLDDDFLKPSQGPQTQFMGGGLGGGLSDLGGIDFGPIIPPTPQGPELYQEPEPQQPKTRAEQLAKINDEN